eukprot:g345.t1
MQAIRQKLAVASTRRRLKQLWLDYKKASGLGEAEESRSHLSALMDSIAISEPAELNTIFDDWSEIVTALLEVAGARPEEGGGGGSGGKRSKSARAAAELAEKSLRVAETIVRDDRYRERLRELPRVLERVLAMLDGVETVERQRFVVRVLHHLTDAMASRYELHWAHSVDFKKVLKLLVAPDPMLKRDVLRLLRALIQQAEHGTGGAAGCQSDADAGSLATRLIHFPLAVVAKVAQSVWGDVSPNPCSPPETGGERLVAAGEYAQAAASSSSFPPSGGELCGATQRLLARRKLRVDAKSTAESAVDAMIETGEASTEHPPVRELLCMQGAVQALVDSLIEADSQTDGIEVVDTLRMLLLGNTRAQNDFRGIGGYAGLASFLRRFCGVQAGDGSTFGSAGGPSGSDDGVAEQRLLGSFFDILFTLTLDGMRSTTIQNFDALTMLFDIACGGNNVHARLAVRCLRDLLAVDAMNVVAFDAVDGAAKLLAVVATYMRKHDKMAPEAEFDGLFALIQDIDGLLQYVAVLESALDAEDAGRVSILGRYAQLFAECHRNVRDLHMQLIVQVLTYDIDHIVFTYYETSMSLFVDGRHVQDVDWTPPATDNSEDSQFPGAYGTPQPADGSSGGRSFEAESAARDRFSSWDFRERILSSASGVADTGYYQPMHDILKNLVLYDMSCNARQRREFNAIFKAEEDDRFKRALLENVLDGFDMAPVLHLTTAHNTLRNLNAILDKAADFVDMSPELCARIVMVIDLLSYHNSEEVRAVLMDTQLFYLRDTFVLQALQRRDFPLYRRMNALSAVEGAFDSLVVSQQSKWNDIQGVVQIFRMLLQAEAEMPLMGEGAADFGMQRAICEMLRVVLEVETGEGSCRALACALADAPPAAPRFMQSFSWGGRDDAGDLSGAEDEVPDEPLDITLDEFVAWLHA